MPDSRILTPLILDYFFMPSKKKEISLESDICFRSLSTNHDARRPVELFRDSEEED
jgi:hypothetical protein